jgi:hypothetical protein
MTASSKYRLIRLALAREPGHPEGDIQRGYRLVLPLTADGRIDDDAYRADPERCHVIREETDGERVGRLKHGPGGKWSFHYTGDEDDVGFRFGAERFVPGEYVSIRRDDGDHTYQVVSQQPL